jgi:hypothetical protein
MGFLRRQRTPSPVSRGRIADEIEEIRQQVHGHLQRKAKGGD